MASQTIELTESLYKYLLQSGIQESPIAQELRAKPKSPRDGTECKSP
ncbi:MAG: hypothetical protein Ct9H300mP8_08970 [Gammaproteobacteria bacterium]|nr:MAG: hypothetical protein Ct9H300mP8_08970 [Gammaproteobacteria bacterium]